jgi:hypothetical protein
MEEVMCFAEMTANIKHKRQWEPREEEIEVNFQG